MNSATSLAEEIESVSDSTLTAWRKAQKFAQYHWTRAGKPRRETLRKASFSRAFGLRELDGDLLVPMYDAAAELWAVQQLPPEFRPCQLRGRRPGFGVHARQMGLQFRFGPPPARAPLTSLIGITEHVFDAMQWHEATGIPAVVAFTPENLVLLAGMVRTAFPAARVGLWGRWPEQERAVREAAALTGAHALLGFDCETGADPPAAAP